jgi:hypothetical protein
MFTGGESDQNLTDKSETILKLHKAGLKAEVIANCLSLDPLQVNTVVMSNDEALTEELARLQVEAKGFKCALSRRLTYEPVQAPDGSFYERRVLKKWIQAKGTWPNSSIAICASSIEVLYEMGERVGEFSLRAFEVLKTCIRRDVQKEVALDFAAECLAVQDLEISKLIEVLSSWSKEEQGVILKSFQTFNPGLLKRLLLSLAAMPTHCGLTLLITDVLEEAQLISRHVKAKDFIIRGLRRKWAS